VTPPFDGNTYRKQVLKPLLEAGADDFDDKFALVDLDPGTDDDELIRARIAEVVAFWRREQSQPRYKGLAAALLAQRDEMRDVLLDPGRRSALRARLAGAREEADAARYARVDDMLEKLAARNQGALPRDRVERLRAVAERDGLSAAEFESRVSRYRVVDGEAAHAIEPLPELVRNQLRQRLEEYNRLAAGDPERAGQPPALSLFGFLGVPADVGVGELRTRLDALGARNRQRRHDRLRTVTDELLAHAKTLLVDGDPARYVASLALDVADDLRHDVEAAILLEDKVNAAEFDRLVREAVGRGLDPPSARSMLSSLAVSLGGGVEMGVGGTYVLCSTCGSAEDADPGTHRRCRRCNAELYRPCPRCRTEVEVSAERCGSCGLDLRAVQQADRMVRQAQEALAAGRPVAARQLAERSAELVGSPGATAVREQAEAAIRASVGIWQGLLRALDSHRYGDAAELVDDLAERAADTVAADGRTLEDVRAVVDRELAEVRAEVQAALSLAGGAREEALVAVLERHPADARDALAALKSIPVVAPSGVRADLAGDAVVVTWQPSPSPGAVTYRVARVTAGADGQQAEQSIGSTGTVRMEDAGAPAGLSVSYSVTALRHGLASGSARSHDVLVAREVEGLTVRENDGRVELSWRQPPTGTVWVGRTREDAAEPLRQFEGRGGSFVDTSVENGATYHYRVHVEYRDRSGQTVRTLGREVTAQPQAPPPPLRGLLTSCRDGRVRLTWPPPPFGRVHVVRVADLAGITVGTVLPAAQLGHLGRELTCEPGSAVDPEAAVGPRWYVPFTVAGGQATVGSPVRHNGLDDVEAVTAADEGRDLVVRWQWPDACTEAQVVYERAGEYAEYEAKVTNSKYQVDGGWRLRDAPPGEYTIGVVPGLRQGNELVWAPNPGPRARVFHRRG
jgi:hypothetical protein